MNGRKWTAEEDLLLEGSWHSGKPEEIAERLSRSVCAVHCRANGLKLVSVRWWTETEIEYLKAKWHLQSALEISNVLARSVNAIQLKASKLNLKGGFERESLNRRTGRIVICDNCGKEFYRKICLMRERNFCGRTCANTVINREILLGSSQSPNKAEIELDSLLQSNFPGEYKFNGNYSQGVSLGGLIPDFVNVNGKKQVIELFGEYWHDTGRRKGIRWKSTEFGRKAVYSQLGFDCLIIWSKELESVDALVEKLRAFN